MYHHFRKLLYPAPPGAFDPRFGNGLLEPYGGAFGQLATALQCSRREPRGDDFHCEALLMDLGKEELRDLDAVQFIVTREVTRLQTFMAAVETKAEGTAADIPGNARSAARRTPARSARRPSKPRR